ncbi:MAG: hypothetical protein J5640_04280 [Bacteroidales bacterium]|nr:hypothetical protein [Bacteroidales bacterium]
MKTGNIFCVIRWALVVLIAFGASAVANAQDDPYGGNQVEQLMNRKREAEAEMQRKAEAQKNAGCKIIESSRDTLIGAWHSSKNMIISKKQYESGPMLGKFIAYKVYYDKGAIANNEGKVVAKLTDDGLEILDLDMKVTIQNGGVAINGEPCGVVTRQDITIYGRRLGYFSCEATRELVAFFFLHDYLQPGELQKMKTAREEQKKREAEAEANFKANMMKVTAGNFTSPTGNVIGKIDASGNVYNKSGQRIGHVSSDGKVTSASGTVGSFNAKGMVYDKTGSPIGRIQPNGSVEEAGGSRIGQIYNDGNLGDRSGSTVAKFSSTGRYVAAVCYYFFFRM